jgi:hypothetical protein
MGNKDSEKSEFDRWSLHGNFGLQLGTPAYSDSISSVFSPQRYITLRAFGCVDYM